MPDSQFYTKEAATALATEVKTALALSKLWLGNNSFVPGPSSTAVELEANELEADGYTAGGYALTAWTGPLSEPTGGATITSPLVNVNYNTPSTPPKTGSCSFWWVEDASGDVRACGIFDPPRPMAQIGDGWPQVVQLILGRNPSA